MCDLRFETDVLWNSKTSTRKWNSLGGADQDTRRHGRKDVEDEDVGEEKNSDGDNTPQEARADQPFRFGLVAVPGWTRRTKVRSSSF